MVRVVYLGHPPADAACPRYAASCVCHLPPPPPDPRACQRQWWQPREVDMWRTCAPNSHICPCGVHVQIRCVMIWQSGVDELGIAEARPPAPRRPTGRPYGRRGSAPNSSSSLLTLLLARSSFLMNPCFHLCRSEDSALVIPHVSHCFISPPLVELQRAGGRERHRNRRARWLFNYSLGEGGCCIKKWGAKTNKSII